MKKNGDQIVETAVEARAGFSRTAGAVGSCRELRARRGGVGAGLCRRLQTLRPPRTQTAAHMESTVGGDRVKLTKKLTEGP